MPTPTPPTSTDPQGTLDSPRSFTWVKQTGATGAPVMQTELPVNINSLNDSENPTSTLETAAFNMLYNEDFFRWERARATQTGSDSIAVETNRACQIAASMGFAFNGTTFDRVRNNLELELLASAARTASVDSADFTNYNGLGAHFIIDVSAIAATPSIVPTIQGKDPVSGNYYDILVGAAITTVGTTVLKVHPGISPLADGAANDILPRTFRISITAADADSITYSVGANLG